MHPPGEVMMWEERYTALLMRYNRLRDLLKHTQQVALMEHEFDETQHLVEAQLPLLQRWWDSMHRIRWWPQLSTPREYVAKFNAPLRGPRFYSTVSGDRLLAAFLGSFVAIALISLLNQY